MSTADSLTPNPSPLTPIWWLLGLGVGLAPLFLYDLVVFGGALLTGYGTDLKENFRTPLSEGAVGLLVSPGKGLIWYAPPVLLSLWGFRRFARAHRAEAVFVVALASSLVIFFGSFIVWPGGGSWGPRYLAPLLPFVMLPALEVVQGVTRGSEGAMNRAPTGRVGARVVLAVLFGLGFLVNVLGALVNFDTYINVVNDEATRYWRLDASPILGHARLLGQRVGEAVSEIARQPGTVLFESGFSYSEGGKERGELLPRWTTGAGELEVRSGDLRSLAVTLRLADHSPPELPRARVAFLVNGGPAQTRAAPVKDFPISTDYSLPLPPGAAPADSERHVEPVEAPEGRAKRGPGTAPGEHNHNRRGPASDLPAVRVAQSPAVLLVAQVVLRPRHPPPRGPLVHLHAGDGHGA